MINKASTESHGNSEVEALLSKVPEFGRRGR